MYTAYAQLQPGDAVVKNINGNHVMLVSNVVTVRDASGKPLGDESYVTLLHQTVRIADKEGNPVQESTCYNERMDIRQFDLQRFHTEDSRCIRGKLDLKALAHGKYHCTHTVLLMSGKEIVIRDFMFNY